MQRSFLLLPVIAAVVFASGALAAPHGHVSVSPIYIAAINAAERSSKLPPDLLATIARVESDRPDPAADRVELWPWTIGVGGTGYIFATEAEAIAAVERLQASCIMHHASCIMSIDIGCMQVNLLQHPDAFPNLKAAFDPATNVAVAARCLWDLFRTTESWPQAAAAYHSRTPDIALPYERRVMAAWPLATRYGGALVAVAVGPSLTEVDPLGVATPQFDRRLAAAAARRARDAAMLGPALAAELPVPELSAPRLQRLSRVADAEMAR